MSREKIEEIYEVLTRDCDTSCVECKFDRLDLCVPHHKAEALYNAGYRKQSEVIDEFVKRLKDCAYDQKYYDGTRIPIVEVNCIDRIAKEMKGSNEK